MDVDFLVVVSGNLEEGSFQGISFSSFPDVVRLVGTFVHNPREGGSTIDVIETQEVTTLEPVLLQDTTALSSIAAVTAVVLIRIVHPSGVVDDQVFARSTGVVVLEITDAERIIFTIGSAESAAVGGSVILVGTNVGQGLVVDIEVFNEVLGPKGSPVRLQRFALSENASEDQSENDVFHF